MSIEYNLSDDKHGVSLEEGAEQEWDAMVTKKKKKNTYGKKKHAFKADARSFPLHCGCLSRCAWFAMQVGPAFHTAASNPTHRATGFTHFFVLHGDAFFLPPCRFHGRHTMRWST